LFEHAFVEFLYLDRMLITGGFLAISDTGEDEVSALLEFAAQARCYEPRSPPGSALPVLRKLGRQHARETPFPVRWRQPGEHRQLHPELAVRNGDPDPTPSGGPEPSSAGGATLRPTATRELYLARARAAELETRAYELGARLVDAELRTAREISELRGELERTKAAHQRAEQWLARINSSPTWRLIAPLRWLTRRLRAPSGR
jgi:hypothetical protein